MKRVRTSSLVAVLLLAGALGALGVPQANLPRSGVQSASYLIRFLTYQDGRDLSDQSIRLGAESVNRATSQSLVRMGPAAAPDLERALQSPERQGPASRAAINAGWLMCAYAKIKGPAAFALLRRLLDNPNLSFYRDWIGDSISLSLGLTSLVIVDSSVISAWGQPVPVLRYIPTPRETMDDLIFAWVTGDRKRLVSCLR